MIHHIKILKLINNISFTDSSYRDTENKNSLFSNSGNKIHSIFGINVPTFKILSKQCDIITITSKTLGLQFNKKLPSFGTTDIVIKGILKCNCNEHYVYTYIIDIYYDNKLHTCKT